MNSRDLKNKVEDRYEQLLSLAEAAHKSNQRFRDEWKKGFLEKGIQYKLSDLYKETLAEFRKDQDAIGNILESLMERLQHGDLSEITTALAFLKVKERFFRSGYLKKKYYIY